MDCRIEFIEPVPIVKCDDGDLASAPTPFVGKGRYDSLDATSIQAVTNED